MLERLDRPRVAVRTWDGWSEAPLTPPGTVTVGGLDVTLAPDGDRCAWSIANASAAPISVLAVVVVGNHHRFHAPFPVFCEGYQSWSRVRTARLGIDHDDSRAGDAFALFRGGLHADPDVSPAGELRSERVLLAAPPERAPFAVGFAGGTDHHGTVRVRVADDHVELAIEANLGGAVLAAGEHRALHPVRWFEGADPESLLVEWATWAGREGDARTEAPFTTGWCSWYHYFHEVTETDIRSNLARIGDWPLDVFQIDDGYQRAIGDWLVTNDRFSSPVEQLADDIAAAGRRPGIWWAPFLVAPDSEVARAHPDWVARFDDGEPLIGMINDAWGGVVWALDPTVPEVIEHLRATAAALRAAGFAYQKLDFTYAPALPGRFADPSCTPAQRVRRAFDAVRAGAGDDTFLLGCGAPLAAAVGVVDGMRIGPDVAPSWTRRRADAPDSSDFGVPGYEWTEAATLHAWNSTVLRAYLHRRLWANDPDCVMLRSAHTDLSPSAARAWALGIGVSGGMVVVSDDLALLEADARALLDDTIALARASDDAARHGPPPRCADRLSAAVPTTLTGGGHTLQLTDPHDAADPGVILKS